MSLVKEEMSVSKLESDSKIADLKKKKRAAKTALTKATNKLSDLLEQEYPSRKTIRGAIDQVCSLQSKVVNIICDLALVYHSAGDLENCKKTNKEIDTIETIDEVVTKAQVLLNNTFSSTALPHSGYSGVANLFKDQAVSKQVKQGSQSVLNNVDTAKVKPTNVTHENTFAPVQYQELGVGNKSPQIGQDLWRQLKQVSIPTFSGKVQMYDGWRAAFLACIDSAPATNEYKLLQLRQYLSGEAAQLISKLGHSSSAYNIALVKIDRKYGVNVGRYLCSWRKSQISDRYVQVRLKTLRDLRTC